MTFRTRLLGIIVLMVAATVALVSWIVAGTTRQAFERMDDARTAALVGQFRREFDSRRAEVVRRVDGIANAPSTLQIAIDAGGPNPDLSRYVDQAKPLADAQGLDFLELVGNDGAIISSAQWPARFGYKEDWIVDPAADWRRDRAFLDNVQLPDGDALALVSVGVVEAADKKLYVVGGERVDQQFLASLVLPSGMRVVLHRETSASPAPVDRSLAPIIDRVRRERREAVETVGESAAAETIHAIPLLGRQNNLLGVLLVASSRRELAELVQLIRTIGFVAGGTGILVALVLAWWATARVTRPVQRLAEGAREVAAGNWNASVEVPSGDEIGALARAFNQMTHQLIEQRDRLLQAERVAAWRELARRLAHELKNPLFPLQITVENMKRARERYPEQFEEVFQESTATLLTELSNLKQIIGRFSDFAKMPPPELQQVDVNEVAERAMSLYRAQLGRPAVLLSYPGWNSPAACRRWRPIPSS